MNKTIVELVNTYAELEAEFPNLSVEDFCVKYLANRVQPEKYGSVVNGQLAALIGKMSSFASLYSKKALQNVGVNNTDDWIYLITLHSMGNPKKSELIYEMVSEFPSGIDVIKRLTASKLVEEYPDEEDRRSKRLRITPQGQEVLTNSFPYMMKVGEMAFSTMTDGEKVLLLNVLKRLDNFHTSHYKDIRTADFKDAFALLTNH